MPGTTLIYTSTGDGKDHAFSVVFFQFDPQPSFAIGIRADPGNTAGKAIKVGRGAAIEPFYADDSRSYNSCKMEDLILNDQGNVGLILYVDNSGPMDPRAQYATVVQGVGWYGRKGPNDPTP